MEFPVARQQFYQEIQAADGQIDLARAALYIAQEEYPTLDPEEYLNALRMMAEEVSERLPAERYPLRMIRVLNHYLFEDLGFRGNRQNYYDPDNSFLNQVLDRRTGIPITLSLVYLEVAKRLDFAMEGVGMPGHFLIRPKVNEMEICVDPFHQGEVLFPEDCRVRLEQVFGQPVEWRSQFLNPVSDRQFLSRLLTNLKMIYLQQQQFLKALGVVDRILLIFPKSPMEWRDRGLLYYQLGRWSEARFDLERYLEAMPTTNDAPVIRQLLERIQSSE